jgi:hypothetical protein
MSLSLKNLWRQYLDTKWEKKIFISAGALALIPLVFALLCRTPEAEKAQTGRPAEVDTYIPKGFVLVPIEVANYEALDSILGRFAVVDLFQSRQEGVQPQRLVARNVRLLRAPQNPSHFAILVQESAVAQILRSGATFTVIVKRHGEAGTEFVKEEKATRRQIVYEGASK